MRDNPDIHDPFDSERIVRAVTGLVDDIGPETRTELFSRLHAAHPNQFGRAAMNGAAPAAEFEPGDGVLYRLSSEQRAKAARAVVALAEKFDTPSSDFAVIQTDIAAESEVIVCYAAYNGIDRGAGRRSLVNITYPPQEREFLVEVGGQLFDSRQAMREAGFYEALISHAKACGMNPLPDSRKVGRGFTTTWLGEARPGGVSAFQAHVDRHDEAVYEAVDVRTDDASALFRPGIVLDLANPNGSAV